MDEDPGDGIYRAMIEENGMPRLGASAEKLGIRKNLDISSDPSGLVQRPRFQPSGGNGLSCAPTIQDLPKFALPLSWGGTNRRTVVWRIDANELDPDLIAQEDSDPGRLQRQISIGPARTMTFDEFVTRIEDTRTKWKRIDKN